MIPQYVSLCWICLLNSNSCYLKLNTFKNLDYFLPNLCHMQLSQFRWHFQFFQLFRPKSLGVMLKLLHLISCRKSCFLYFENIQSPNYPLSFLPLFLHTPKVSWQVFMLLLSSYRVLPKGKPDAVTSIHLQWRSFSGTVSSWTFMFGAWALSPLEPYPSMWDVFFKESQRWH